MLHDSRFLIVDSGGNSVHIGPPSFTYSSSNTVYPKDPTFSPFLDVCRMWNNDVVISIVGITDHPPQSHASLDAEHACLVLFTVLWEPP
jgi:hypothetical protein